MQSHELLHSTIDLESLNMIHPPLSLPVRIPAEMDGSE